MEASNLVRERLLMHWVNSLPLTKCLLVEKICDLRYGDVLYEIVRWLEGAIPDDMVAERDVFDCNTIEKHFNHVVQFAASECRSLDEEAIFLVNDTMCLARAMSGQSDTICAILTVLRRLSGQQMLQHQAMESSKNAIWRRGQENQIELCMQQGHQSHNKTKKSAGFEQTSFEARLSSKTHSNIFKTHQGSQEMKTQVRRTLPLKQGLKQSKFRLERRVDRSRPFTTGIDKKGLQQAFHGPRVGGMPAPTLESRTSNLSSGKCADDTTSDDACAIRFCNWTRDVLQIEMPSRQVFASTSGRLKAFHDIRQIFADGALLCRVAAGIRERYGGTLKWGNAQTTNFSKKDSAAANTSAKGRHNLSLAIATFKRIGLSMDALNVLDSLRRREKHILPEMIWRLCDEIVDIVNRLNDTTLNNQTTDPGTALVNKDERAGQGHVKFEPIDRHSLCRKQEIARTKVKATSCAKVKRHLPYVTNEQIRVVNEWLVSVGFEVKKVSDCALIQNPMRNGVLLCALLIQTFDCAVFTYHKSPRTLAEMRENISLAFKRLDEYVLPCYITSSAEHSVLIGDRQVTYGILWHLWQAYKSTALSKNDQEKRIVLPKRANENTITDGVVSTETLSSCVQPSPLLLDIPAITLATPEKEAIKDDCAASYQMKLHDNFARRLAWGETDFLGDSGVDDIVPVPTALFPSPVSSDENDIFPIKVALEQYQQDDILPKIAMREVSAADVHPITLCDSDVAPKRQDKADDVEEHLPNRSPVQSKTNGKLSKKDTKELFDWLKRLGVRLENICAFLDPEAKLIDFQSGVLLCCIVEKVELMRSIQGVTRSAGKQALSKASALHNINKALKCLQQKKTMPLHLLRRASAIYAGDRDVILQLLAQIRKAYGHHLFHLPRQPKKKLCAAA